MKKLIESLFGKMILNVAAFVAIWPLLDLVWTKLISQAVFEYSVYTHLVKPAVIAVIFTLVEHFVFRKK